MAGGTGIFVLLSLLVLQVSTQTNDKTFHWTDCSSDKTHQSLIIHSIQVSPVPLSIPGVLHLSFNATVLKPIYVALMDFKFVRNAVGNLKVPIACVNGVGSCSFDGCTILKDLGTVGNTNIAQNVSHQISTMFSQVGANISCPIQPQSIVVNDFVYHIPKLSSAMDMFLTGDYNVTVILREPATDSQLGCLTFGASIVRSNAASTTSCEGWLCDGKRRRRALRKAKYNP